MEHLICKECGKEFESEKMSGCKRKLGSHLKIDHNMEVIDYIIKHEYGGVIPLCPCGCGHELNLRSSGDRWKFNTYYSDTCYGRLVRRGNSELRKKHIEDRKRNFDLVTYYESHYDRKTYEDAYNMFKTKQYSLTYVSKEYQIDKRTLKNVWLAMKIATQEELSSLLEYTKYKLSGINCPNTFDDKEPMLAWMYNMAKAHPGKYTIHSIISEYNKSNKNDPCTGTDTSIAKSLYKVYGDEIDILLAVGYHSSEEYEYFNVLRYFFDDYRCKLGKKFILDGRYVYYDYIIGSRLLIEYDSIGKFHQEEKTVLNDKEKEEFAINNGYSFLRLSLEDTKDINTLIKIKSILENDTNRN